MSAATTRPATSTPKHVSATPGPHRSPRHPGRRRPCCPGTSATSTSPTPLTSGRSPRCGAHPAQRPTTNRSAPAALATRLPSDSSRTAGSASCTIDFVTHATAKTSARQLHGRSLGAAGPSTTKHAHAAFKEDDGWRGARLALRATARARPRWSPTGSRRARCLVRPGGCFLPSRLGLQRP